MDTASNVIDLAARRVEWQGSRPTAAPTIRPATQKLEERQRETIEKLRALGYEMCHKRRD